MLKLATGSASLKETPRTRSSGAADALRPRSPARAAPAVRAAPSAATTRRGRLMRRGRGGVGGVLLGRRARLTRRLAEQGGAGVDLARIAALPEPERAG